MVDRTGLENRRAARSRGFESLSLRHGFGTKPTRTLSNSQLIGCEELTCAIYHNCDKIFCNKRVGDEDGSNESN